MRLSQANNEDAYNSFKNFELSNKKNKRKNVQGVNIVTLCKLTLFLNIPVRC